MQFIPLLLPSRNGLYCSKVGDTRAQFMPALCHFQSTVWSHHAAYQACIYTNLNPFLSLLNCSWTILKHQGFDVNFTLLAIDIPYSGKMSLLPLLRVLPGSASVEYFMGRSPPVTFMSKSLELWFLGSSVVSSYIRAVYQIVAVTGLRVEHFLKQQAR